MSRRLPGRPPGWGSLARIREELGQGEPRDYSQYSDEELVDLMRRIAADLAAGRRPRLGLPDDPRAPCLFGDDWSDEEILEYLRAPGRSPLSGAGGVGGTGRRGADSDRGSGEPPGPSMIEQRSSRW